MFDPCWREFLVLHDRHEPKPLTRFEVVCNLQNFARASKTSSRPREASIVRAGTSPGNLQLGGTKEHRGDLLEVE